MTGRFNYNRNSIPTVGNVATFGQTPPTPGAVTALTLEDGATALTLEDGATALVLEDA